MNIHRFSLLVTLLILGSILLSACTGSATALHSWPGVSASQDTVYLAYTNYVYVINASNGSMTCRFPEKPDASKPFFAAPAITDNLIIAGNYGHQLFGITKDCKQQWAFDSETGHFAASPLVINNTIIAPSSNYSVYALSMDGKQLWKYETKNSVWATPVSDGKLVYVPSLDHTLYALNLSDGSLAWKADLGSSLVSGPLLAKDGTLFQTTLNGSVVALKGADGSKVWTSKPLGNLWGTPLQNEDTLFVGDATGKITALSAKDGTFTWQKDATTPASPIIAGGMLLKDGVAFPTEGGSLAAWPFNGEKQLWIQPINGKLYTTPVMAGQTLVVAVTEGESSKLLQALSVNGQLSWSFVAPK